MYHNLMRATAWAVCALVGLPALGAGLGRDSRSAAQNTERVLQQQLPPDESAPPVPEPAQPWIVSIGLAREAGPRDDRALNTPFVLGRSFGSGGNSYAEVSGDGYLDQRSSGERGRGLADLTLLVNHNVSIASHQVLVPEFELMLPTQGEVGSRHAVAMLRLGWSGTWDKVNLILAAAVGHDGNADDGVSTRLYEFKARLKLTLRQEQALVLQAKHTAQRGDPGALKRTLEYDFPIAGALTGALVAGTNGAPGQRSRLFEFDLGFAF